MENEKKRFRKEFQMWKACEAMSNSSRKGLEYICFENDYAYASDGHILAKVSLECLTTFDEEEFRRLNGHCIHAKALKMICQFENIDIVGDEKLSIVCYLRENTIEFNLAKKESVIPPDFEQVLKADGERHSIDKIGIEKSYLNDLTDAMGVKRVKMDFYSENSKIIVTPIDEYLDVKGVVMPILTTGTLDFEDDKK